MIRKLIEALGCLTAAINAHRQAIQNESDCLRSTRGLATKQDLRELKETIMSTISELRDRVTTRFDAIDKSVDGIVTDIEGLKKKIEQLQNSPGAITPEDQALLDGIEARVNAIADKVDALDVSNPVVETETPTPPTPA